MFVWQEAWKPNRGEKALNIKYTILTFHDSLLKCNGGKTLIGHMNKNQFLPTHAKKMFLNNLNTLLCNSK